MKSLDPAKQRQFAVEVAAQLRARGYQALWAGGCVRDSLLNRRPKDYDVATNATPEQIQEVFRQRKTLAIGAAFGVIAVVGPRGAGNIEVTTFRRDAGYADGRHPDSVTFSTAEEDAQRRDFTINGLFYDPLEERVIDYVGGVADIERRIVRAIGDARQRFHEDKLRMLRAVRMSAALEFELDAPTLEAVRDSADKITVVSAERISQEMRVILTLPARRHALGVLLESRLLHVLLPEVAALVESTDAAPEGNAWDVTVNVLATLDAPSFPLALAALLHRFDNAFVKEVGRRWRLANKERDRAAWLVAHAADLDEAPRRPWPFVQRLLIHEGADELVALHAARAQLAGHSLESVEFCRAKLALPPAELNPRPLVTGDDLLRHGVTQGNHFAALLEAVRDAQLLGEITTRDEALHWADRWVRENARGA
jgi:tRNA nucleotidyltransferase/poly(A) polymerase